MSFKSQILLVLIVTFLAAVKGQAQYMVNSKARTYTHSSVYMGTLLDAGIYYGQTEATASPAAGNTWQNTTSVYDIKLGQIFANNIYAGVEYSIRSDNQFGTTASGNSIGTGLGYFTDNGFYLRAFYKFNETYGDYSNGAGYQAELGFMANMSSNFYMGINVGIRQITFKSNSVIPAFDYWTRKETYPFLTLGFLVN